MSDHLFENLGPKDEGNVAAGFLIGFAPGLIINLLSGCASLSGGGGASFMVRLLFGIAIGQLIFTLPSYFYFKNQGKVNSCRGLLIGASVACLIGAACGVALTS